MPYDTVEEAIDIANGTRYGLGASVFGPEQDECLKVAKRLECGMVSINDFAVFYVSFSWFHLLSSRSFIGFRRSSWLIGCLCGVSSNRMLFYSQALPFGGVKSSGYGRFGMTFFGYGFSPLFIPLRIQGGPEGLRSLTNLKAIIIDRWPSLIQTSIPKVIDYPLHSFQHSWFVSFPVFMKAVLDFVFFCGAGSSRADWYVSFTPMVGVQVFTVSFLPPELLPNTKLIVYKNFIPTFYLQTVGIRFYWMLSSLSSACSYACLPPNLPCRLLGEIIIYWTIVHWKRIICK